MGEPFIEMVLVGSVSSGNDADSDGYKGPYRGSALAKRIGRYLSLNANVTCTEDARNASYYAEIGITGQQAMTPQSVRHDTNDHNGRLYKVARKKFGSTKGGWASASISGQSGLDIRNGIHKIYTFSGSQTAPAAHASGGCISGGCGTYY